MLKKWLREPLLHFLLIGGSLFLLYGLQNETSINDDNRIVINEADIERLITLWQKKRQRLPTQLELNGLIEQRIREEVMYREAMAMGLEHNDPIVRRRLAQKVEFISSDLAELVEPADTELSDYLDSHRERFELPARINFEQVYLNIDQHGEQLLQDAQQLLNELRKPGSQIDINTVGDPFMFGQQHSHLSAQGVSRLFGQDFANTIFSLPVGSWQGPVSSGYGVHLVRIGSKTVATLPELAAVQDKVRNEWQAEQRRQIDESFYQSLRQRYQVIIEGITEKGAVLSAN